MNQEIVQPENNNRRFRGPSRALKYKKLKSVQPGKLKVNIPPALGTVVGERANQLMAECADWVKEICPLNVNSWKDMPEDKLDQLYGRIQELEAEAESQHEDGHEVNESIASNSNATTSTQASGDPMYLKLWDKSKRHKNGKFDDEAEVKFNEFRKLHEKEIGEKGADNLTLEEAYEKVLGHCSDYARGLGKGHPVLSKDGKKSRAELESNLEQLQNENNMMRARTQELERKLQLVMEKIGLDA